MSMRNERMRRSAGAAALALAALAGMAAGMCLGGDEAPREGAEALVSRLAAHVDSKLMQSPIGSVDIYIDSRGVKLPGVEDLFRLTDEQKKSLRDLRAEYEREKEAALRALRDKYEVRVGDILSASQRKDKEALEAIGREFLKNIAARLAEREAKHKELLEQSRQGAQVDWAQFSRQAVEEGETLRTELQEKMKAAVSPETKARLEALFKEAPSGASAKAEMSAPGGMVKVGSGERIMVIQGENGRAAAVIRVEAGIAPGPGEKGADPAAKEEKATKDKTE